MSAPNQLTLLRLVFIPFLVTAVMERNFKLAFYGAMFVETAFILSFILLADLSNRLHLLLLISTISCYSIVILGLFALGAHINRAVARVLKAIELK